MTQVISLNQKQKKETGQYHCHRCQASGKWQQFKNLLLGNENACDVHNIQNDEDLYLSETQYFMVHDNLLNKQTEFEQQIQYLTSNENNTCRHIDFEVLKLYKVGLGYEDFHDQNGNYVSVPCVYFPMFTKKAAKKQVGGTEDLILEKDVNEEEIQYSSQDVEQGQNENTNQNEESDQNTATSTSINNEHYQIVRTKIRGLGKKNKRFMRLYPTGQMWGLFGLNTVPVNAKEVIVTEGEYDAMAAYQATGIPSVSLPNGAQHLPEKVLRCFDQFETIYLWMDQDLVGQNLAPKLAEKLGQYRTKVVNTQEEHLLKGPKDANDALRIFKDDPSQLRHYIRQAKTVDEQNILRYENLALKVSKRILRYKENTGTKTKSLQFFNQKVKGLRFGEFTILTGPTGSGKTTFLSQLSLEVAQKGVRTLWGSFEIQNDILASNMLMQFSNENLQKRPDKLPYFSERFLELPIYFLSFYGQQELEQVYSSINFAVEKYNVQHVIIDNLQFLIGTQVQGYQVFQFQDKVIQDLRQLATQKQIHITLVIHPKKVSESEDLDMSSVFGSAKSTQEADNVFIIQRREHYRVFDVKKNRFDGDVGRQAVMFDRETKRFIEVDHAEIKKMNEGKTTPSEVLQNAKLQQLKYGNDEDNEGNDDGGEGNNDDNEGGSSSNNNSSNDNTNINGGVQNQTKLASGSISKQKIIQSYYEEQKPEDELHVLNKAKEQQYQNKQEMQQKSNNNSVSSQKSKQNNEPEQKISEKKIQQDQFKQEFQSIQDQIYDNIENLKNTREQNEQNEIDDLQSQYLAQMSNSHNKYEEETPEYFDEYDPMSIAPKENNNKQQVKQHLNKEDSAKENEENVDFNEEPSNVYDIVDLNNDFQIKKSFFDESCGLEKLENAESYINNQMSFNNNKNKQQFYQKNDVYIYDDLMQAENQDQFHQNWDENLQKKKYQKINQSISDQFGTDDQLMDEIINRQRKNYKKREL